MDYLVDYYNRSSLSCFRFIETKSVSYSDNIISYAKGIRYVYLGQMCQGHLLSYYDVWSEKKMLNKWKDNAPNQGKHPQNLYGFC